MAKVFVSYARKTSATEADALSALLRAGGHEVFFDRTSIEDGADFPRAIVDGLLDAHAFVALFDEAYSRSWYCVRELRVALAAWTRAEKSSSGSPRIVIGLGEGIPQRVLDGLPPDLRARNWRWSSDVQGLAVAIGEALRGSTCDPFGRWLTEHDEEVVELSSAARLPPVVPLSRHFPSDFPLSLHERFRGRTDELWSIHLQLVVLPRCGASTVLLQGFGGVGKSRLALEYVHRFGARHFPGGVFWLDAGVPEVDFARQMHELARSVGIAPDGTDDPRGALVDWADRQSEPVLLVVDNLPSDGSERPLSYWCPLDGHASVLATARERRAAWEKHVHAIEVGALAEDAAVSMLASDLDRTATAEESWRAVVNAVGGLPLALHLLNTGLRLGSWQPSELVARIQHEGAVAALEKGFDALRPHVSARALRGIGAAFEASFSVLSPDAQRVTERLATLSPAPIPIAVVAELADDGTRAELVKHSIVLPVPSERDVPVFGQMHRLYADFMNAREGSGRWLRWLPGRWQPRRRRMIAAIRDVSGALAAVLERGDGTAATLFALVTHVEWVHALARHEQANPEVSKRLRSAYIKAILSFAQSGGTHGEAFRALQTTIREAVADASHELLSSIELIDRTLSLDEPLAPGELELDILILRDPTEKSPNVTVLGSDPDDPEVQDGLRRPLPRARELYQIRRSMLGETHPAALGIAAYIALAALALRDLELAHEWFTIVHRTCRTRYGERAPNTVVALWHLCSVLIFLDRDAEARELRDRDLLWVLKEPLEKLEPRLQRVRANLCIFSDLSPEQLERAMEAHDSPANVAALRGLLAAGDRNAAIAHFSLAIELGERSPEVFLLRCEAREAMEDFDGALRDLAAARDAGLELRQYHSKAAAILIQQSADASDFAMKEGKAMEAMAELDAAIDAGSVNPNDHMFRGGLRRARGAYAEAEADLRRAIALGAAADGPARLELAKALHGQKKLVEAIVLLTEIIGTGTREAAPYLIRGEALFATGYVEAALRDVRACLALDPGSEEALLLEGRCLAAAGEGMAARGRFDQVLRSNRDSASAMVQLLFAAMDDEDYTRAFELVNRLLAQSPGYPGYLLVKVKVLRRLERYDDALAISRHLTSVIPDDADAWSECGWSHFHLLQFEEALHAFRRNVELDPGNIVVRRVIAGCLNLLERKDDAMRELGTALAEFPQAWELRVDRAKQLREDGRSDEAIAEYRKALQDSGGDPKVAGSLVDLLWDQNRYDDAVAALESVPEAKRDETILNRLALSLRILQRYEEAKLQYGKAISADPAWGSPRYGRAIALRALGRPYGALTDLESAIRIAPQDSRYLWMRAEVLFDLGRPADSAADFRQALEYAESPDLDEYGRMFLRAGDFAAAAECLEKALAADAGNAYARELLAEVLLYSGDIGRAAALLEDDSEEQDWTMYLRGLTAREAGDPARFDLELRKALAACDPDLVDRPLEVRELFNRALYLAVLGEHDAAMEAYTAASADASLTELRVAAADLQRAHPGAKTCLNVLISALDAKLRPL